MSKWSAIWGRPKNQPASASPGRPVGHLSAGDIDNVAFAKPPIGQRGYNMDEVDSFLAVVAGRFRDDPNAAGIAPADIRNVAFSKPPLGQRGYNEDEVDAFLELCAAELGRRLQEG
ncbi:DivIVA domain-containing protein [Gordonia amarae]|uniref:Cell wall synthesis protein Wag31 n=2 Tax=Gordonia amarae TaxID=36821 RepID=G7GJG2_9ACTN|nr:DivIVA domain-containing protein [Gordonia amarae]MCS3879091.1 DivIVA domain-containing protein [Gordonia amarae]QHN17622.1 DivIVA domain-containing protein [Gordonia amarae]QHN22148.1 DivIVA domain-containing protein [Gordonia amarae]QHN31029.1 DivIVA domain-containing protein [Gordonia amarae]QHN39774.1 DivIVA domain-containing protein [Gordonia amarae]